MGALSSEPDDRQLAIYMHEVIAQADLGIASCNDLATAVAEHVVERAYMAAQSFLSAAAMLSKLLWYFPAKQDGRDLQPFSQRRAERLREALNVDESSPLHSRDVRNSIEHFDVRLDRFFAEGGTNVVDRNIGPATAIVCNGKPARHLRLIDPQAATIAVLETTVNINKLTIAMVEIRKFATQWLQSNTPR